MEEWKPIISLQLENIDPELSKFITEHYLCGEVKSRPR